MAYSTLADLLTQVEEAVLVSLTDDENTGEVDENVVSRAIVDADAELDGYLGVRYSVPLETVPAVVRKFSVDVALWNLYSRRPLESIPGQIKARYEAAVRFLEKLAKGEISLGADDPEGAPSNADAPQLSGQNPARRFTRGKMSGF